MWVEYYIWPHIANQYIYSIYRFDGVYSTQIWCICTSDSLLKWNLIEMTAFEREPCDYTFLVVGSVGAGKSTFDQIRF